MPSRRVVTFAVPLVLIGLLALVFLSWAERSFFPKGFFSDGWRDTVAVGSLVVTVAGLVATIVGLYYAIVQIRKTKTAAQAAEEAANRAVRDSQLSSPR
jgi:uncharacterized membrane protein